MGKIRKAIADVIQLTPATILGYHKTIKECPKCGSMLNVSALMSQLYFCPKCGYHGPIALNPEDKRKKKTPVSKI